jgi:hypothetical protein
MKVLLSDIDFDDLLFKISRDTVDEGLEASIRNFGILDPPVLLQLREGFRIVFGFNRLGILKRLGQDAARVDVLYSVDPEWYIERALLKCHRNESGPVGRLKILFILRDMLAVDPARLAVVGKHGLHIPENFIDNRPLCESIMNLPDPLMRFIDHKDIQYKTIRDMMNLPESAIGLISRWIGIGTIRVNIFKNIVEMLSDICARDGGIAAVENIMPDDSASIKRWDDYLLGRVFPVRYPAYSAMKNKADEIVRQYDVRGVHIDYPAYFEGDSIDLKLILSKRDDPAAVKKKINDLDVSKLRELLDLL